MYLDVMKYINDQALVLVPVLYILGMFFKVSKFPNKYIPVTLLFIGIVLSMLVLGFTVQAFIQGILVAGAAVFTNQLFKQMNKDE